MRLTSYYFSDGGELPEQYTCHGQDENPALNFLEVPSNTESLALIMEDPDALGADFVHWILYNIPPTTREIKERSQPAGATSGTNSEGHTGWISPCPPAGKPHHYKFTLYALTKILDLSAGADKLDLITAMSGSIIAQASLTGVYESK